MNIVASWQQLVMRAAFPLVHRTITQSLNLIIYSIIIYHNHTPRLGSQSTWKEHYVLTDLRDFTVLPWNNTLNQPCKNLMAYPRIRGAAYRSSHPLLHTTLSPKIFTNASPGLFDHLKYRIAPRMWHRRLKPEKNMHFCTESTKGNHKVSMR